MAEIITKKCSSERVNLRKETVKLEDLKEYLAEEVKILERGGCAIIANWKDVDTVLDCFEDTEEFEIEQLSNTMFAVLPTLCLKKARKEFEELKTA